MFFSIDLETACAVKGCIDHGKSICRNDHSLSPWHSKITVAAAVSETGLEKVFRGESKEIARNLKSYLSQFANYTVGGHTFKFDWLHLAVRGFQIPLEKWVSDSNLAAYVLTEKIPDEWLAEYEAVRKEKYPHVRPGSKHSLKTLAPYFIGVPPFWEAQDHDDDEYVLNDTRYTRLLISTLENKLKELGQFDFYVSKQLEWVKMLVYAEFRGLKFDTKALEATEHDLKVRSDDLKSRLDETWAEAHREFELQQDLAIEARYSAMYERAIEKAKDKEKCRQRYNALMLEALDKAPYKVDYDSPKQMAWLLRDYYGYNITGLDGKESTGKEVLERLAVEHEDVRTYLEWRKTNKLLSAYIPAYKELVVDGVVHPIYNATSTRTGRTSCERPNIQQVSPRLKPLFVARPGYKLIGYDQAAIEARLIALYTEDEKLYEIINSGKSLHDNNVKVYFNIEEPIDQIKKLYPRHREAAKNVGFALFYHAGWNRIRIAMAQKGFMLSESQCRAIHKRVKNEYAEAFNYAADVVRCMEEGEVIENLLGRPLKIENPEDAYMKAFNMLIQSSASDLLLHGGLLAWRELRAKGIDAHPTKFVHDYVEFEVKEEQVELATPVIKDCLTGFHLSNRHGPVRLEVEGGVSIKWEK